MLFLQLVISGIAQGCIHGLIALGIEVMDTMMIEPDMFGGAKQTFSPTKRLDSDASRMSQITDGKWKFVSQCFH